MATARRGEGGGPARWAGAVARPGGPRNGNDLFARRESLSGWAGGGCGCRGWCGGAATDTAAKECRAIQAIPMRSVKRYIGLLKIFFVESGEKSQDAVLQTSRS